MALNVIVCIPACRCVYQCSGGVVMYTEQVTTQPLPEREDWPCSMVGFVINGGGVQEGWSMINWAQDLICNILMKMKRGSRVVLCASDSCVCSCFWGMEGCMVRTQCPFDCMCSYTGVYLSKWSCVRAYAWWFFFLSSPFSIFCKTQVYKCTNHLTLPRTKLQFTVELLIKFKLPLPEGNDIVLQ